MRVAVDMAKHVDLIQQLLDPSALVLFVPNEAKGDVASHAEMREQSEVLKHQTDGTALRRDTIDCVTNQLAVDINLTAVLHIDARDDPQRRRFPAT